MVKEYCRASQVALVVKNPPANAGDTRDMDSTPGSGRAPGGGGAFSSVAQSCLILCDLMDCSTPGFLVLHHLQESAQTHVRCVGDAIQPSHPLPSLSPLNFSLSQHQGLLH